jgi:phenylpropionate dioxygenase-like ring-hydroxylating dioxygenase large terminal subunit
MIRNQWYAILESHEVKKQKLIGITRFGEKLVLWRDEIGKIYCIKDKCAHRGASLSAGKICPDSLAVQCPFHGFEYDISGKCRIIPANGKSSKVPDRFFVDNYPVKEFHEMIFIWWGDQKKEIDELPFFTNINDKEFSYITFKDKWPVHYSRAIENQLDLVHVPFVHYNTIGRGNRTLVNGPVQLIEKNQIFFWVFNEKDFGQIPKKAEDLPQPDMKKQHIHFIVPNIWQNWINSSLRVFVAFVPIDNNNTLIYMRTYQKFVILPIIKHFIDLIMFLFSRKVLLQDKRVVITQIPIQTSLKMNENLIQGDLPIITYRKIRDELIQTKKI